MKATSNDIQHLEQLYENRQLFFGDLHNHAATGGTSDGKRSLEHWKGALEALHMDFAAILDHRQVRHMYLPEWENGTFICGTEPGTVIDDSKAEKKGVHYNMLFPAPSHLEDLLAHFEEYKFEGGPEGHFSYPHFTRKRFCEIIDYVKEKGGFFVHPHPKQLMVSSDPLDYWFRDETGIEVFYGNMRNEHTALNYALWTDLLSLGKRVWACAGDDGHACAGDAALTAIYAEEKTSASFVSHLRMGDFVCGSVGIKMCIEDTPMGGICDFTGKRLILSVDHFHKSIANPEHAYRIDIITDSGVVQSEALRCDEPSYFALNCDDHRFYRVEIFDATQNLRIAIGNPIWNKS